MPNNPTHNTGSTASSATAAGVSGTGPDSHSPTMNAGAGTTNESTTDQMKDRAREAASSVKDQAGETLNSGMDMAKRRAAESLQDVASSLKQSCESRSDGPAHYINAAGDRVQRAADYLENTDTREMVRHSERFARSQPALFLGGAFALGILAARFLKSSRDEQDMHDQQSSAGTGYRGQRYDREESLAGYREPSARGSSNRPMNTRVGPTTPLGASSASAATTGATAAGAGTTDLGGTPGAQRR